MIDGTFEIIQDKMYITDFNHTNKKKRRNFKTEDLIGKNISF